MTDFNHTVRRITPGRDHHDRGRQRAPAATRATAAPATSARLNQPGDIAVDGAGNVFIGEFGGHRVRRVSSGGTITTIAGTGTAGYSGNSGPATSAQLSSPGGVDVDSAGNVFIAEYGNHVVRKVTGGHDHPRGRHGLGRLLRRRRPRRSRPSSTTRRASR